VTFDVGNRLWVLAWFRRSAEAVEKIATFLYDLHDASSELVGVRA
jgi:hypothetical protein